MSKTIKKLFIGISLLAGLGCIVFTTINVRAASSDASPIYKALLYDVYKCYNDNAFKNSVKISDISKTEGGSATIASILQNGNTSVLIPTGLVGTLSDTTKEIKCSELLNGRNTFFSGDSSGIIKNPSAIPSKASSSTEIAHFLETFGYEPDAEANSGDKCFRYVYDYTSKYTGGFFGVGLPADENSTRYTDYICIKTDDTSSALSSTAKATVKKSSASTKIVQFELKDGGTRIQLDCDTTFFGDGGCGSFKLSDYSWDSLKLAILGELAGKNGYLEYISVTGGDSVIPITTTHTETYRLTTSDNHIDENTNDTYKLKATNPSSSLIKELSGSETPPKITKDDVASLYITYLMKFYKAKQVCDLNEEQKITYTATGSTGYGAILYRPNAEGKECYIYAEDHKTDTVNGMRDAGYSLGYYLSKDSDNFESIVKWLRDDYTGSVDVNPETATPLSPEQKPGSSYSDDSDDDEEKISKLCLKSSGAKSLSWVACPLVSGMAKGTDGVYGMIKKQLEAKATLVSGESPAHEIWNIFRNFANIIFAFALVIVIVSQVTGYGIDNYGIKKMLPRLIITGLLVNLSYIICQLAVDASNIFGTSANLMLSSWINTVSETKVDGAGILGLLEVIFAGVASGAATSMPFLGTVIAIGGLHWWIILIAAGIILLIILILAFTTFLMLGARQILVIVAVAISPVAFICYALPNTEKLFKKWFDIFKGALLVYPICSLLSGIGEVIKGIIFTPSGGGKVEWYIALVAAAAPFIPFVALPSLLKGSLKAVGDLGNKIAGINTKAAKAASAANSAFRNSDTFKDAQFQTAMRTNQKKLDKFKGKSDDELSDWQKRRKKTFERRALAYQKAAMERDSTNYEAQSAAISRAAADKQVESARTLLTGDDATFDFGEDGGGVMAFNYRDDDQLWAAYQHARGSGDYTTAKAIAEIAGRDKSAAGAFIKNMRATGGSMDETMAKFITGSKSASNFRAASGLGFEYIQQMSRGQVAKQAAKGADGSAPLIAGNDFSHWVKNKQNVQDAVEHHITNANELYGQKGGELQYLRDLKENGGMNDKTSRNIAKLAYQAQLQASNTGTYDATKDDIITELRKGYTPAPGEAGTVAGTPGAVHVDGTGNPIETGHEFEEGTVVEEVPDSVRTARASAEAARATSESATASGSSSESNVINYVEPDTPTPSAGGTATSGTSASSTSSVPRRESASVTHGSGGTQGTTAINGGAGTGDYFDVRGASTGASGGGAVSGVNQVQNVGPRNAQTLYYAGKHTDIDRALRDLNYVAADGSGGTSNPSKALLIDTSGRPLSTSPNPTPAPGVVTPASTPAQPASPASQPAPQSAPQAPVQPVTTPQTQQPSAPSGSPSFVRTDAGTGEPRPGRPRVTLTPMDSDNSAGSQPRLTSSSDQGSTGHGRGSDGTHGSGSGQGSGRNPRRRPSGPRRSK